LTAEPRWTADYDFALPPELVAQEPLPERSASRMLMVLRSDRRSVTASRRVADRPGTPSGRRAVDAAREPSPPGEGRAVDGGVVVDTWFAQLPSLIPPGDLLVLNTTRVRHARLLGSRASGAPAEVLLIHPAGDGSWIAMGKPGSALQPGKRVALDDRVAIETLEVLADGHRRVRVIGATAEEAMARFGRLPLPPYITRDPTAADESRYQTVYARGEGSVAAPTAGLHFTPQLLDALSAKGVVVAGLDLQVGPGTFKPVDVDDPRDHPMHPERYEIPSRLAGMVELVREQGGRVWAVGTTVVRALESAARDDGTIQSGPGETRLMITPGYAFRVVDRLLTNFHLPRSTLLMLVSAFAGYELTLSAYAHAVSQRYRFYSYGDAMVVL
jgi:S-adenosylmethionine:tRNA ribosyltransferase-isomerase